MISDAGARQGSDARRSRMYRINAVVLRRRNLGESDRILTVFGREVGKHRFVAKGVRRPGSKMAGHSEPFMIAQFLLSRTRSLPIASQAETVRAFPKLRSNERAIATAGLIAERVDVLTAEDEPSVAVYGLLESSLDLLDQGAPPDRVQLIFDLALLREAGFRPGLQSCLECGAAITPTTNGFHVERGGLVCHNCAGRLSGVRPVTVDVQKILRMIDRGDIGQALAVRVNASLIRQAATLVADHVTTITGRDSTASRVIRDLRLEYNYQESGSGPEGDDELP